MDSDQEVLCVLFEETEPEEQQCCQIKQEIHKDQPQEDYNE